ncbi:MAG: PemK family transcriptional regulator [Candidatus Schekmanbacteria bacterium RBG_13_48_7]|uniref:mRNA interferase n=1 Tax=Candidatus Schekmanbacteria bacterium RBG_13_48_7 TaxID=1817878 RepID=A0A1F7S0P6_9BACT|nr:MAG: PemK family transcriptional regulator [Candidatus Schekmanbacteria bacterium RBG_13_48_7]
MVQDIKRGEIYWVDWSLRRGSEQSGLRPALVIQNDIGNKYSPTTIVTALTTAIEKSYPFLIRVTAKESGLPKDSTVNLAVILTIDKSRLISKCGEIIEKKMAEVDEAIKASLGLR